MVVLFIVRATLYNVQGGDTIQILETAKALTKLGIRIDIRKTDEKIDYNPYDLLHFFNIIRPADILTHVRKSGKRFVVSTILVDYSMYDKYHRPGVVGKFFNLLTQDSIEYVKTLARFILKKDKLVSFSYIWKGQRRSIIEILKKVECVFVHAEEEYRQLVKLYHTSPPFAIVYNGVDLDLFKEADLVQKEQSLVICAARIEGIKNQYNLIRALNNTPYNLLLIGDPAPNQKSYYSKCKKIAEANIAFIDHLPQEQLKKYYAKAKVHVLPSWFEICGLSSLEAAAMGCQVVVTRNGYAREYFGASAFYCDPSDTSSIFQAIDAAARTDFNDLLQKNIILRFNWKITAEKILSIYKNRLA